ncbi:2-C-methyl-D-erythritol 4-phosphate cytidylyltransferase [Nesterenkonia natronophila]|uniref:Multifunctional fusion protein n=1 Tax=Nesterenkonia natronophila TaxID=2174932 RepID=A0A3A4FAW8_9MICC|nr:2-C-methyl-D-erythritol 4-phosphate cytidylyltransferase [Nesterenkonia natronophila]RJN32297.1 2-C-methyl-D-erythritol 2,4-cyclodiphosphate synthase [Nesterenkonia natronophila]
MTQRPDDAVLTRTVRRRALVVVAAGSGTRLGLGMPKAAVPVTDRTVLEHALDAVSGVLQLDLVVLVLPREPHAKQQLAATSAVVADRCGVEVLTIPGGEARTESVSSGVRAVQQHAQRKSWSGPVQVLVHDAARALTPTEVFHRVLEALDAGAQCVVPALPVTDTIKRVDASAQVAQTLPRKQLRAVQTPQGFTLKLLERAFSHIDKLPEEEAADLTDEAMMVENLGEKVAVVEGHPHALKITTSLDLLTVRALIAETEGQQAEVPPAVLPGAQGLAVPRVGIGHDIHAFASPEESAQLWLAGLHWPGERGLAGHSDADPVAHAACAALFSAAGMGDLGTHFGADTIGTSRAEYRGASGFVLLSEAAQIVRNAGYRIGSVSVQFVGNRPKFATRREEAQQVLTEAAGAPVAISATTSDGLGFTGRGEGIAATATAVLY